MITNVILAKYGKFDSVYFSEEFKFDNLLIDKIERSVE